MPIGHQSTPGRVMNGNFASTHGEATREQYERGIQVIDEDKEFRYVLREWSRGLQSSNFSYTKIKSLS